jgi:hypothetical protein
VFLQVSPRVVERSEPVLGFRARGVGCVALAPQLLSAHVEVRANFLIDAARDEIPAAEREPKELPDARADHAAPGLTPISARR